jgi:hypothetical protein
MSPEENITVVDAPTMVIAAEPRHHRVVVAFDVSDDQTRSTETVKLVVQLSPEAARRLAGALTEKADEAEGEGPRQ